MDAQGVVMVLGGIGSLAGVLVTAYLKLRSVDRDQQHDIDGLRTMINGIVLRGYAAAKKAGFIAHSDGRLRVAGPRKLDIEAAFSSRKAELKKMHKDLIRLYGRPPDDIELALEIERRHQQWLVSTVCPLIEREAYECVAIAACIARENGSTDHKPESWTPGGEI